ncbi:hypothetical protein [Aurantimonas marina]|uniref:hypothetical protein n=1 Tax=Aurantimonas marina TaxID=2780508 RepID=UPI002FCDD2A0
MSRDVLRLVGGARPHPADVDFLKRDNISIAAVNDLRYAFRRQLPIRPDTPVDIVGQEADHEWRDHPASRLSSNVNSPVRLTRAPTAIKRLAEGTA